MGPGNTANFQVQYEDTLANLANVRNNANALLAVIENEFTFATNAFATPSGKFGASHRQVVNFNLADGSGANNSGYGSAINLDAQSGNGNASDAAGRVGMLFENEWVEILMSLSGGKWNAGDSMGEGLSQFFGIIRFQTGHYSYYTRAGGRFFTEIWMNTVPRQDWVTQTKGTDRDIPSFGCALGFIFYLNRQLNFSINQIIAAGASNLATVYKTLTADDSNPYPFFSGLLEHVFPSSATTTLPGPVFDNPFPLAELAFWVDKNTFGKDEVLDVINGGGGVWPRAFWLVVEGFSSDSFAAMGVSVGTFSGAFARLPGISLVQGTDIDFENPTHPGAPQRIRIPFDVKFTSAALADFPMAASATYELDVNLTIGGTVVPGSSAATVFELVAGADPYFTNIDPAQNNVYYLSQDLRVFSATPALNNTPVPGGPAFGTDSSAGAFTYIQNLLALLNTKYSNPNGTDPFSTLLPAQGGALQGDSSVTPLTVTWDGFIPKISANYNFAIARVRLRGTEGAAGAAQNVRVFFRLWSTETADTDYVPSSTYPSTLDGAGLPASPLVGADHGTLPFFATGNLGGNSDYGPGGANTRTVQINSGDSAWAYFGCFLNIYDPSNMIDGQPVQAWLNGTHHCLVAQIAFDGAPVVPGANPESSDKLAQRNLQVTVSDNPGPADTHRIPQTFDIRPSGLNATSGNVDELMIDWGMVPTGSVATIYWPQVMASDVLALAKGLYGSQVLTAADVHTIQCPVTTAGVTYVPIPAQAGANFAGLITIDLPLGVVAGQEFNVVVRRISSKPISRIILRSPPMLHSLGQGQPEEVRPEAVERQAEQLPDSYRYVVGTFQVKIPVTTGDQMLFQEENTLAIMKWRLQQMKPANRWYPVLQRYIQYIAARVDGLGGNSANVPPSITGVPPTVAEPNERRITGRVCEVIYDCYGDFEGFVLEDCADSHAFRNCRRGIEQVVLRACRDGLRIAVAQDVKTSRVLGVIVLGCC
jgi:hypothetical protein